MTSHGKIDVGYDDTDALYHWWTYPLLTLRSGIIGTYRTLIGAGGGLSAEGAWRPAHPDCLVHVTSRSGLFRATCRAYLHKTDLVPRVDAPIWTKAWAVPCQPGGRREDACRSLAPDICRDLPR